eukprot:12388847-Prorocentrum_lima.AAC.1
MKAKRSLDDWWWYGNTGWTVLLKKSRRHGCQCRSQLLSLGLVVAPRHIACISTTRMSRER